MDAAGELNLEGCDNALLLANRQSCLSREIPANRTTPLRHDPATSRRDPGHERSHVSQLFLLATCAGSFLRAGSSGWCGLGKLQTADLLCFENTYFRD